MIEGFNYIDIGCRFFNNIFELQANFSNININQNFLKNYKKNLLILLDHCCNLNQSLLTLSDINYIIDRSILEKLQTKSFLQIDDLQIILDKLFCTHKFLPFFLEPFVSFCHKDSSFFKPIFIFPPGHGGIESYLNNLVPLLNERNLILFNNIALHIRNLNLFNIYNKIDAEKLAMFYILYIKKIQPIGPYNFLGWSFGGILAIEICRILKEKYNDTVLNIFLIDSAINISEEKIILSSLDNNFYYEPKFLNIDSQIFLFKALILNDQAYGFFHKAVANNIDKIIDIKNIKIYNMPDDDHMTWIHNQYQLEKMAELILENTQ